MNPLCGWWHREMARCAVLGEPLAERSRLGRHVARCERCRAAWDELRHLASDLSETPAAPTAAPAFTEGLWERIASAAPEPARRLEPQMNTDERRWGIEGWPRSMRLATAGLAGATVVGALLLAAWLSFRQPSTPQIVRSPHAGKGAVRSPLPSRQLPPEPRLAELPPRGVAPATATELEPPGFTNGTDGRPFRKTDIRVHLRQSAAKHPVADDLKFLNDDPAATLRRWVRMPEDEIAVLTKRLRGVMRRGDDFVSVPLPRLAHAGSLGARAAAQAVAAYQREVAVVDARLIRKVSVSVKGMALSDLCERLRTDSGIALVAGSSIADEKVTLFCREMPLRDVMRQLSRPFGYTWLRSGGPPSPPMLGSAPSSSPNAGGEPNGYRYELVQDLRSQLMEEELRSRDHHAALVALDREMSQYRRYLGLSPDEALVRSKMAPPEEKKLLERYAGQGWGAAQLYFRLSPNDLAALRAGQSLTFTVPAPPQDDGGAPEIHIRPGMKFSLSPEPVQQPLPPELARGVLQSHRDGRVRISDDGIRVGPVRSVPDGLPPASVPEARPIVTLKIDRSELGQLTLQGNSGFAIKIGSNSSQTMTGVSLAVGVSPAVQNPENAAANAKLGREPALQRGVTIEVKGQGSRVKGQGSRVKGQGSVSHQPSTLDPRPSTLDPKVTSADVLEALHRATGMPIVADYYTRLYPARDASVGETALFDALNRLGEAMHLRWMKDGEWLQFRSASFFNDRLKEVPNRMLARWAASRQQHGALTLSDLMEIAGLPDAQLHSNMMAEGARSLWGLEEWGLPRNTNLRPHLHFLAGFSPAQQQAAQSAAGLPFAQMALAQQQWFITSALGSRADQLKSLEELARATLRVEYTVPGWFQWAQPQQVISAHTRLSPPSPVRERTREAALQAARRLNPSAEPAQIVPTELQVKFTYTVGGPYTGPGMELVCRGDSTSVNSFNR